MHYSIRIILLLLSVATVGCIVGDDPKSLLIRGSIDDVRRRFSSRQDTAIKIQLGSTEKYWAPPLHVAVEAGRVDVAEHLVDLGADPNSGSYLGETAFCYLPSDADDRTYLALAQILLAADGDINMVDGKSGATPLMNVVAMGNPQKAEILLECGADPSVQDKLGRKAIDYIQFVTGRADVKGTLRNLLSAKEK